jgi:hypothetical protein
MYEEKETAYDVFRAAGPQDPINNSYMEPQGLLPDVSPGSHFCSFDLLLADAWHPFRMV